MKKIWVVMAVFWVLWSAVAFGQVTSSTGMGTVNYKGWSASSEDINNATRQALVSAIDKYIAEQASSSVSKLYDAQRSAISGNLEKYIISSVVLSNDKDTKAKTVKVVVRAEINAPLLRAFLDGSSQTSSVAADKRSSITFLFMAREAESVQSFKDRVYQRSDNETRKSSESERSEKAVESEDIRRNSVGTEGFRRDEAASVARETHISDSGGSTTAKADLVKYRVASSNEINIRIGEILSAADYEVVDAEFVQAASKGFLDIRKVRESYSSGDDLPPEVLNSTVEGVRAAEIPYLAIGTLDVGIRDIDPVSGNTKVFVTVTGKILDISGRFPKTVSSVGPVQFAGLGPNAEVAKNNALLLAAGKAAQSMVDQLNLRKVK